jgi:hypothetical protein
VCISERSREGEETLSVIEINYLLVWSVIPDDKVKVAVTIQIGERRGISPIRPVAEIVSPVEVRLPVI